MKNLRKLGIVVISALLLSLLVISPANADPIEEDECYPAVLMLRGSGEGSLPLEQRSYKNSSGNILIETNGFEGERIGLALDELSKTTDPAETISKLRFIGIDYPALPVPPEYPEKPALTGNLDIDGGIVAVWRAQVAVKTVEHFFSYLSSIEKGAKRVESQIEIDEDRGCHTQYLLMGYSQGALAARLAMTMVNNPDKIL